MDAAWFALAAATLATYVVLDGFDLGAGILHLFVARGERQRKHALLAVGPVWDGNEVWLIAFAGTFVMAFPSAYAAAFSGFYLPLMIVLWLLVGRACAVELRHQMDGAPWAPFWDRIYGLSSLLLVGCLGALLGNGVRGVPLDEHGEFFQPLWTDFLPRGTTGFLDVYTVLCGFTAVAALSHHGALWLVHKLEGEPQARSRVAASRMWWATATCLALVAVATFEVQPRSFERLADQPLGLAFPALALAGLLLSRLLARRGDDLKAFLASGLFLVGLLFSAAFGAYPYVLPSNGDPAAGLTAAGAAASEHALSVGLWWWIPGIALAAAGQAYVYRRFAGKAPSAESHGGY